MKKFNASTNEVFVVISGTEDIDGKYILDDYWGELDLLSQGNWGRISIEGSINVPFEGIEYTLNMRSPQLEISSNIFNTPLQSIDFSGFTPFITQYGSSVTTLSNVAEIQRSFFSSSDYQIESFASAQAAINSYNIDSDLLDSDGDGYAVWRDDDDTNPSITQAAGIYTLSSALTEIASLESQKSSLVLERDAALAAQATAEAERDAKLTLDEVKDLRAGSTMIAVENEIATLSMEVEESDDLETWTSGSTTTFQVPADSDTKFYRFKMTE